MKKLKNKKVHEYTIRVHTWRELYKIGKGGYKWGDMVWCACIDEGYVKTSIGGFKNKKELFDEIRRLLSIPEDIPEEIPEEEVYLKDFLRSKLNRTYKWLKKRLI
ncbi:MAG: hypothetical protein ACOCP4_06350 [Candidatus Woesearchaeota archaeon]